MSDNKQALQPDERTCACCGKEAPECDDRQPWCDACRSTGEIIVDDINSDEKQKTAA